MYVIQVSGTNTDNVIGKSATNQVIVPADRCVWVQAYNESATANNDHYTISTVRFYDGSTANGTALNASNTYQLGFVGKTGRFVPITV